MTSSNEAGHNAIVVSNPWDRLRQFTPARIALGRSGVSLPTGPHLEFQLAHARARNAVHHELNILGLQDALDARGYETIVLHSGAESRPVYLQRPDKGRRLDSTSRAALEARAHATQHFDVVFVIGDGLSALAIEENAVVFLDAIGPSLRSSGWTIAPLVIVREARVAVGDEVGELLGADLVVILIGERPGLSSPDSMGIYMTHNPRVGLTDESRNCLSNIRPDGMSYKEAAHKLMYLLIEARRLGLSGVHLKDGAETLVQSNGNPRINFLIEPD